MTRVEVAERLSSLFETRGLRSYAYWKVRADPAYGEVLALLRDRTAPLLDLGCGIGLLAFFLREHGYAAPIRGVDFDARKIDVARRAATKYRELEFVAADAREGVPFAGDVVILDMLQYFDAESQQRVLASAASSAETVILRQGIADGSWRHRFTLVVDALGRAMRWMKAERLHFPTRDEVTAPFAGEFDAEVRPMWGRTPYNNYLFVFRRSDRPLAVRHGRGSG